MKLALQKLYSFVRQLKIFLERTIFDIIIGGCILFMLLTSLSMHFYPGGTYHNPKTSGYSFELNVFSDLGYSIAHNGKPNQISKMLFSSGMAIAAISLLLFFTWTERLLAKTTISRPLLIAGRLSCFPTAIFLIGIGLAPADLTPNIHAFFVTHAFIFLTFSNGILAFRLLLEKQFPKIYAFLYVTYVSLIILFSAFLIMGPDINQYSGLTTPALGQKFIIYTSILVVAIQSWKLRGIYASKQFHQKTYWLTGKKDTVIESVS